MREKKYFIGNQTYLAPPIEPALYLVSTPIGHLCDISLRALSILAACDVLVCEDKRVTKILLDRYVIRQHMRAYHEHNAKEVGPQLIEELLNGKSLALVSDAGTPLISDPGYKLVDEARKKGINIIPIPGASALLAALVATGLPTDSFFFAGFLTTKKQQRKQRLEQLCSIPGSLIFYESPHRVKETLVDMAAILGFDRRAALCRELTKKFETVDVSTLGDLAKRYGEEERIRGEIVLVVEEAKKEKLELTKEAVDALLLELSRDLSTAKAAAEAMRITGLKKQDLFQRLVQIKK
ncbi:16S rRNA (cytidine(1402)-2'-O)-methyltransferase [Bartonella tamiae]|uniref:Ribosomal RNA small subunit methyltransferase I n=1 Tax=Bartonella tamiae Th239 TaxID=1094558 RepID=J1JZ43_9HYPH|nr:16S rRNA (cytidine(1402)-2'-O)-methyltransferase [Bartonella tamiae]EJF90387.1 hypothetical protein ME5_00788 [Bartonella tamiae Th239]EJF93669.1 hypothetical protein MEG_01093 [Bartonella tamiae Th307]